jgi:hypothetical protein
VVDERAIAAGVCRGDGEGAEGSEMTNGQRASRTPKFYHSTNQKVACSLTRSGRIGLQCHVTFEEKRMNGKVFLKWIGCLVISGCLAAANAEEKVAKLTIVKAEYGDLPDGTKLDVTDKVKAMVNAEGLNVDATNENFTDPIEGTAKKLKVEYTLDDKKLDMTVNEGETLVIELKPSKLKIVSAFYGDLPDGNKTDVTAKVQAKVHANALSVDASNDNFGDPAEGVGKKLKVEYSFDGGDKKTKEAGENEKLEISNKGE